MKEIELKAHVDNRTNLIKILNEKAHFINSVTRDDLYYGKEGTEHKKIRIRKETTQDKTQYLITYKRKELKKSDNNISIEVNDEMECTISSPEPLEAFLTDNGFTVALKKHKDVMDWTLNVNDPFLPEQLTCTFELCNVPPLGDFIEIEILYNGNDSKIIDYLNNKLLEYLDLCCIPREKIENRYYSELLKLSQQ